MFRFKILEKSVTEQCCHHLDVQNKLEYFILNKFFKLSLMLAGKARANPKRYISRLNKKHETRLELVADDKHASFLPSEHLSSTH